MLIAEVLRTRLVALSGAVPCCLSTCYAANYWIGWNRVSTTSSVGNLQFLILELLRAVGRLYVFGAETALRHLQTSLLSVAKAVRPEFCVAELACWNGNRLLG